MTESPKSQQKKTQIYDYVTNVMYEMNNQSYDILTYIDISSVITEDLLSSTLARTIQKHRILKSYIYKENNKLFVIEDTEFNPNDHVEIEYKSQTKFHEKTQYLLNSSFNTKSKWKLLVLIDKTLEKSRVVFKINHAYADGHQVIKILTSVISISTLAGEDVTIKFKRQTSWSDKLYQLFIGTLLLILSYIQYFFISVLKSFIPTVSLEDQPTDTLECKPFNLQKIKEITAKHSITVNDFLYACMIRTDYLYTQKKREVYTVSAINVSNTDDLNNIAPLFLNIDNALESAELFQEVHSMFNRCKYSGFIPLFSGFLYVITPFVPIKLISLFYNITTNGSDYMYSNIIGPDIDALSIPITDIHFATVAKNREIIFNIISCKDKVNIICSFKKGRIEDKERFQSCIEEAYKSLLAA